MEDITDSLSADEKSLINELMAVNACLSLRSRDYIVWRLSQKSARRGAVPCAVRSTERQIESSFEVGCIHHY
jgi:hypothetical protein